VLLTNEAIVTSCVTALGPRIRCQGRKRRAATTAANGRDGWILLKNSAVMASAKYRVKISLFWAIIEQERHDRERNIT
jgi:hypothetical protein